LDVVGSIDAGRPSAGAEGAAFSRQAAGPSRCSLSTTTSGFAVAKPETYQTIKDIPRLGVCGLRPISGRLRKSAIAPLP